MREKLIELYQALAIECGLRYDGGPTEKNTYRIIKEALEKFTQKCKVLAIWCYGEHTKMLMADFIYELKHVRYIVDKKYLDISSDGFIIIDEQSIPENHIDGIIISSYKYREEIKLYIKNNLPGIACLDIYEYLEEQGVECLSEYYNSTHPYAHYKKINSLKRELSSEENRDVYSVYEEIIKMFVRIKDFYSAQKYVCELLGKYECEKYRRVLNKLEQIYALQIESMKRIPNTNVVMLCIDGMRRKDISKEFMPKLVEYIENEMVYFDNAYSVSTSTYESLIPAYSGNMDMRSGYYEKNYIEEESCGFIKEALGQRRKIFFYTDTIPFIQSENIVVKGEMQTASEKMWDFLLDAVDEKNGLFYVHILYESHFSYPNPYTDFSIVAEGTSIFFDFLPVNGGRIRTNYEQQHRDALCYLDDTVVPLLKEIEAGIVLYADHGNVILSENTEFEEITYPMLTFAEDLLAIPLAVKSKKNEVRCVNQLVSLMEITNIINSLLNDRKVDITYKRYIKAQRSTIYNPDLRTIYKKLKYEQGQESFELFIFSEGYKLAFYENGKVELYDLNDNKLTDEDKVSALFSAIKEEITLC